MAAADIVGSTVGRVPAGFGTVANGSWLAGIPIRLSLRAKLFIGYAVMLAVSIGGSAFGYRTAMRDREWNDAVARSANVIRHADAAMLTVSDMEARYAEYALTGSASARTAYRVDLNRARSQLTALSDLTGDQVAAGNLFDLSSMPLTRAV